LVEDLNPVVVAIADEQTSTRIHRQRVRLIELTGAAAVLAPLLDQLSSLVELQHAVVAGAVAFGDEDVAVGCGDDVVRLIEELRRRRAARLAKRQQQLAIGAELVDLIALRRARARTNRPARRFAARPSPARRRAACSRRATRTARRQGCVVLTV